MTAVVVMTDERRRLVAEALAAIRGDSSYTAQMVEAARAAAAKLEARTDGRDRG
jgi:hypothetical protein